MPNQKEIAKRSLGELAAIIDYHALLRFQRRNVYVLYMEAYNVSLMEKNCK